VELTAQVLRDLPAQRHPDLLAGAEHFEDAGVYRITPEAAIVQTVDFFPPLVDDPFIFGQIAAANALSDVYAMGARPLTALNIVGYPDKDLPIDILSEILRGGAERVAVAGGVIVGGHSLRDSEIKYGLAVTGVVHPDRIVRNSGARPGDQLVLTKPLGSGVLTSAAKRGLIAEEDLAEAIAVMTALNKEACEAMVEVGVHAATDITGFGLIGHAFEMAEASGVAIVIDADAVPLLARTRELAAQGVVTRAHKASKAYLAGRLEVGGVDEVLTNILADAQTSGGLLISVAPERATALVDALRQRGASCAAVIGEIQPGPARIILRQ
jgi:selenide,water dikinase